MIHQKALSEGLPRIRSALFVPGSRPDFLERAADRGADALIIDLEDAVPSDRRDAARAVVGAWIAGRRPAEPPYLFVRVNPGELAADLAAVLHPGLLGIVLPKVHDAAEVHAAVRELAYAEGRAGVPPGNTRIWPLVETAAAVRNAHAIATASSRVAYMGGGTSQAGDLAHVLKCRWTAVGTETLFIRSSVLVDVRSANIHNPMTGLVANVDDEDALRTFATGARDLGYEGMMAIHPNQIDVINEIFGYGDAEVAEARDLLEVLREGAKAGHGAVRYGDRMVDAAMARWARDVLVDAGEWQRTDAALFAEGLAGL